MLLLFVFILENANNLSIDRSYPHLSHATTKSSTRITYLCGTSTKSRRKFHNFPTTYLGITLKFQLISYFPHTVSAKSFYGFSSDFQRLGLFLIKMLQQAFCCQKMFEGSAALYTLSHQYQSELTEIVLYIIKALNYEWEARE